ncbi:hypothetical protein [Reichenbachiella agariperforans]|uniref:Uncharacterized protein n=1 Tax=Reichenbachiella agariperforans TaxID=156994 RepID=A0A1M6KBZ8_REIAG|nr:hypothetical protein [Reichenbachiella agariperforans]MBU2913502.1 hypothetical protein [Reichenbachiella agariperforans]SHJ56495.1 hypothetical protein SAMN04488028_101520 [Reichenbachiella agariperforans]
MTDPTLQMYLLAFMVVTTWLMVFWSQFRKMISVKLETRNIEDVARYNRLKRIGGWYWAIFSVFGIMTVIYAIAPDLYFLFLPLDMFHHPVINTMGLLILKISVVWIVIAQLDIDKELYKYSRNIQSLSAMELVNYTERKLLSGMLVLFVGYFTTITNIIGLLLVIVGFVIHTRVFSSKATTPC